MGQPSPAVPKHPQVERAGFAVVHHAGDSTQHWAPSRDLGCWHVRKSACAYLHAGLGLEGLEGAE